MKCNYKYHKSPNSFKDQIMGYIRISFLSLFYNKEWRHCNISNKHYTVSYRFFFSVGCHSISGNSCGKWRGSHYGVRWEWGGSHQGIHVSFYGVYEATATSVWKLWWKLKSIFHLRVHFFVILYQQLSFEIPYPNVFIEDVDIRQRIFHSFSSLDALLKNSFQTSSH